MKTKAFAVLFSTPLFSNLFVAAKKGTKMKENLEGMEYQGSDKSFTSQKQGAAGDSGDTFDPVKEK